MLSWIQRLFSDRQTIAADRASKALEDIADTLEAVRDALRERTGHLPGVQAALPAEPEETVAPRLTNGRKKAAAS